MNNKLDKVQSMATAVIDKLEGQTVTLSQLTGHGDTYQAKLAAHEKRMDDMDTMLTKVSNNINMVATQHNLLMAQIEGIRTNAKDAAVVAQSDIKNLRACLISDLHIALESIVDEITQLRGWLASLDDSTLCPSNTFTLIDSISPSANTTPPVCPSSSCSVATDPPSIVEANLPNHF